MENMVVKKLRGPYGRVWLVMGLIMVLTGVLDSTPVTAYVEDKCYCYEEWDQVIKAAIKGFKSVPVLPVLPVYTYGGARYKGVGEVFVPCDCNEVTVVRTVLMVTDPDFVILAAKQVNQAQLNINVTRAVNEASESILKSRDALTERVLGVRAQLDPSSVTITTAPFNVEVVLKGYGAALLTEVEAGLKTEAMRDGFLPGVGTVDTSAMTFTGNYPQQEL